MIFDCFKKKLPEPPLEKTPEKLPDNTLPGTPAGIPPNQPIYRHPKNDDGHVRNFINLWNSAQTRPQFVNEVNLTAKKCFNNRDKYIQVSGQFGRMPWQVIAVIHLKEADFNFNTHLHNGDPLSDYTKQVPRGRPTTHSPPFTWIESATDAISYEAKVQGIDLTKYTWDVANTLFWLTCYNGWGYEKKGVNTPYLWSYTQHYTKGRYVADGKYDPESVARSPGCVPVLKQLGLFE